MCILILAPHGRIANGPVRCKNISSSEKGCVSRDSIVPFSKKCTIDQGPLVTHVWTAFATSDDVSAC
jgi:hypothetical protein